MKKNKLKPFLTRSVLILPALLLLNGNGHETKAMMRGAVGKVLSSIKSTPIKMPNIINTGVKVSSGALNTIKKQVNGTSTITKTTTSNTSSISSSLGLGNIKQNKITLPNITGDVTMSSNGGSISSAIKKSGLTGVTITNNKSATLPNTGTPVSSSNLIGRSNSFPGTSPKRPAPQPPTSSSTLVDKVNAAGITADPSLKPKRPAPPPPTSSNKLTNTNPDTPDPGYGTVPKPIFTPKDPNKPVAEPEQYENVVILNTGAGTLTIFKDH